LLDGHPAEAAASVGLLLAVFACVVAHEYGHALTARRYGIRTLDITLLPIGGVARLERMPRDPGQELRIAAAGPLVNVAIAAALFSSLALAHTPAGIGEVRSIGGNFLVTLLWINVTMFAFNLLPAFPMDGGRVLRALLAKRMDYARATRVAAEVGQAMSFLLGFAGLFYNVFLVFIAVFVFIGATAEAQSAAAQATLRGLPVRDAMVTRFLTSSPDDRLGRVVELLLSSNQQDFPVLEAGRVTGLLGRRELLSALRSLGSDAPIAWAMRSHVEPLDANASLEEAFQHMQAEELPAVPVTEDGELVGMLTMENLAEFLMVREAVRAAAASVEGAVA
jgi:Zn-dependent protease